MNKNNVVRLNSTQWTDYRKKHKLDKKTQIFICHEYSWFKKALIERGWHENLDRKSEVFDLKMEKLRKGIYNKGMQPHDF